MSLLRSKVDKTSTTQKSHKVRRDSMRGSFNGTNSSDSFKKISVGAEDSVASMSINLSNIIQNHVLGHTQEDVVAAVVCYNLGVSDSSEKKKSVGSITDLKNPMILAISVTRTKLGYRDAKLHQIKAKSFSALSLRSTQSFKTIESIEFRNNGPIFSIATTDGNRQDWMISPNQSPSSQRSPSTMQLGLDESMNDDDSYEDVFGGSKPYMSKQSRYKSPQTTQIEIQARLEFVWWLISTAAFNKQTLVHNIDPQLLETLLNRWTKLLLGFVGSLGPESVDTYSDLSNDMLSNALSPAQRRIIDTANSIHKLRLESMLFEELSSNESVSIPELTPEELVDLEYFMSVGQITVENIDYLEAFLLEHQEAITEENINFTITSQQSVHSVSLSSLLSQLLDRLSDMEHWAVTHDNALNKMVIGIEKIEERSNVLDTEERNHMSLQYVLMWFIVEITLPERCVKILEEPSYKISEMSHHVVAALRLDRLIRGNRVPNVLNDNANVTYADKMKHLGNYRNMFVQMGKDIASPTTITDTHSNTEAIVNHLDGLTPSTSSSQIVKSTSTKTLSSTAFINNVSDGGFSTSAQQCLNNTSLLLQEVAGLDQTSVNHVLYNRLRHHYEHGLINLENLWELVATWQQRKQAKVLSTSFVRKTSEFLMDQIDQLTSKAMDTSLFYTEKDLEGIKSKDKQTELIYKLRVKLYVLKYRQVHSTLLQYAPLVGCCERLQPGVSQKLLTYYQDKIQKVYLADINEFFRKLKKYTLSTSVDCRLRSCPEIPLANLHEMTHTFYSSGYANEMFKKCQPSADGKLRVEDGFVVSLERFVEITYFEQLFLVNMFLIWEGVSNLKNPRTNVSGSLDVLSPANSTNPINALLSPADVTETTVDPTLGLDQLSPNALPSLPPPTVPASSPAPSSSSSSSSGVDRPVTLLDSYANPLDILSRSVCGIQHPLVELADELHLTDFDSSIYSHLTVDGNGNVIDNTKTDSNSLTLSSSTLDRAEVDKKKMSVLSASQSRILQSCLTALFEPFSKHLSSLSAKGNDLDHFSLLTMVLMLEKSVELCTPLDLVNEDADLKRKQEKSMLKAAKKRYVDDMKEKGVVMRENEQLDDDSDSDSDAYYRDNQRKIQAHLAVPRSSINTIGVERSTNRGSFIRSSSFINSSNTKTSSQVNTNSSLMVNSYYNNTNRVMNPEASALLAQWRDQYLPPHLAKQCFYLPFSQESKEAFNRVFDTVPYSQFVNPYPSHSHSPSNTRPSLTHSSGRGSRSPTAYQLSPAQAQVIIDPDSDPLIHAGFRFLRTEYGNPFVVGVLTQVTSRVKLLWNAFIQEEIVWLEKLSVKPKKNGVLSPIMRLPAFIEKLEAVIYPYSSETADTAYNKLAISILNWTQTIAQQDTKYVNVILTENFHYLCQAFSHRVYRIIALQSCLYNAKQLYYINRSRYIVWSIHYEMPKLTEFWNRLFQEVSIHKATPQDVALLDKLTKDDLRFILTHHFTPEVLSTHVKNILKRITKHIPENKTLASEIMLLIREHFLSLCVSFFRALDVVYVHQTVSISINDIHDIFERLVSLTNLDSIISQRKGRESIISHTGTIGGGSVIGASVVQPRLDNSILKEKNSTIRNIMDQKYEKKTVTTSSHLLETLNELPDELNDDDDDEEEDEDEDEDEDEIFEIEYEDDGSEFEIEYEDDDDEANDALYEGGVHEAYTSFAMNVDDSTSGSGGSRRSVTSGQSSVGGSSGSSARDSRDSRDSRSSINRGYSSSTTTTTTTSSSTPGMRSSDTVLSSSKDSTLSGRGVTNSADSGVGVSRISTASERREQGVARRVRAAHSSTTTTTTTSSDGNKTTSSVSTRSSPQSVADDSDDDDDAPIPSMRPSVTKSTTTTTQTTRTTSTKPSSSRRFAAESDSDSEEIDLSMFRRSPPADASRTTQTAKSSKKKVVESDSESEDTDDMLSSFRRK